MLEERRRFRRVARRIDHESTEGGAIVLQVQKIACVNDAGFVMWFQAVCSGGTSNGTDTYPIDQSRVIDLAKTPFREGIEFWPEVHAILGKTQSAGDHI